MGKKTSQTSKPKKSFSWFKLLLICLALFVLAKLGQQYQRYQYILAEVDDCRQRLEVAQNEYEDLQKHVQLLYCDSYLEQLARKSLGMIKKGEVVISTAEISDVPEFNEKMNEKDVFH